MQTVGDGTACEEVVLVFTVCEEEEGTGENQDETCGSMRKMWQEKIGPSTCKAMSSMWSGTMWKVQEVGHVQTW